MLVYVYVAVVAVTLPPPSSFLVRTSKPHCGMLVETSKAFVDPSAVMTQMREDTDFWSLPPLTILCWRKLLVITKHPEDGPDIAQMDNTTAKLITF